MRLRTPRSRFWDMKRESEVATAASKSRVRIRTALWFSTNPFRHFSSGARRLRLFSAHFPLSFYISGFGAYRGAEEYAVIDRLQQMEQRYDELSNQMGLPEIITDHEKYQKAGRALRELAEPVTKFRELKLVKQG